MTAIKQCFARWNPAEHKGIFVLLICAAVLIFPNLGRDCFWNDEGENVFWGLSIIKNGLPLAWDGHNFYSEDISGITENLLYVSMPWLSLYTTAGSMALFGETTWAARFPFALAGWATVLMVYLLALRGGLDRRTALCSAGLLLLSIPFFLYARSCRYYAFVMFFTCAALWAFLKLDIRRQAPVFALIMILLFYSLYLPAICVLAALTFLVLVYKPFHKYRRGLGVSLLIIVPVTLPWILWVYSRQSDAIADASLLWRELIERIGQAVIEVGIAVPLLGWLGLLCLSKKSRLKKSAPLLVLCGTVIAASVAAFICMLRPVGMETVGLRYCCGIIPLAAVITALLILCTARKRWQTGVLVLLLGATHLGGNFLPWLIFGSDDPDETKPDKKGMLHVPNHWWQMIFRCEIPGYILELCKDNPGTTDRICQILLEKTTPGDKVFVNYAWESIYFYTRRPLAGKLVPEDSIYQTARRRGVPDYVFDASAADWVVWRPGWGFYQLGNVHLERAEAKWEAQGKTLTEVAGVKDTLWENRPNLYYHRFPVFGILYSGAWPDVYPDAGIFRVE